MTLILSGTNGVSDIDGDASTPALRGTDANSGVFFGSDVVGVSTGGSEKVSVGASALVVNDGGADFDFRVEGDTNANLLFVDAGNDRVGVGTGSPTAALSVFKAGTTFNNFKYNLQVSEGSTNNYQTGGILFGSGTESIDPYYYGAIYYNGAGSTFDIINQDGLDTGGITFKTRGTGAGNATERGRFTTGGYFKASSDGSYIGSAGTYHELVQSANDGGVYVYGKNTGQTSTIFNVWSNRNTTNNSYYVIDYYNNAASATRFRVADSGNVTNTNNSYGAISDVKLKQDIVDAGSQWDDIKGLRVRKFRWKSDPDGFMQMGLVAQEAEEVSPGLIDEHPDYEEIEVPVLDDDGNAVLNEDGTPQVTKKRNALGTTTKAIKYSVLYMKAVKALQEAMERIETLETNNTALEARLAALEAQ